MTQRYDIEVVYNTTQDAGDNSTVPTVNFYRLSHNEAVVRLMYNCEPFDLTLIGKIELVFDDGTVVDSDTYPDQIYKEDELAGEVGLRLGDLGLFEAGAYLVSLKTYNGAVNGSFWGRLRVVIRKDVRIV